MEGTIAGVGAVPRAAQPDPARRRLPRWLARTLVGLIALGVLVVLRIALSLALAWWHYRSTPDFATTVAERPVSDAVASAFLPVEEVLETGDFQRGLVDPWTIPENDPERARIELRPTVRILHGDDVLLDLEAIIAIAVQKDTGRGIRLGMALRVERCATAEGFRAWVRLRLPEGDLISTDGSHGFVLETLALAGDGPDRIEVTRLDPRAEDPFRPTPLGLFSPLTLLLGQLHPTDALPEQGLAYHVRQHLQHGSVSFNGHSDPVQAPPQHALTSQQYSLTIEAATKQLYANSGSSTSTSTVRRYWTWNNQVW
jgi:hypothetical protein